EECMIPVARRITTIHAVAERNRRNASELARTSHGSRLRLFSGAASVLEKATMLPREERRRSGRWSQEIAEAPDGLDAIDPELLANASNEYFYGIGITIEILIVQVLDQLRARYHPAGVMHEIREPPGFVRGQPARRAVD